VSDLTEESGCPPGSRYNCTMLALFNGPARANCARMSRRAALKAGVLGLSGLTLADYYRLRSEAAALPGRKNACILIWLDGGPSQLETYDPKPEAAAEVRGFWGAVEANVKGMRVSETLPLHAKWGHRMAILPSVHHDNGDHFAAAHWMLTGRFGATGGDQTPRYPSVGSYVSRVRGANDPDLPAYVGLPAAQSIYLFPGYQGPAYLGSRYAPFDANPDSKYLGSGTAPVGTPPMFKASADRLRLEKRSRLLGAVDHIARSVDQSGTMASLDHFNRQAMNVLLGEKVRRAFDLDAEPKATAERYGKSAWGSYTLLARRLVEAGVTFVTVDMPHWDYHSSLKSTHTSHALALDNAVNGLFRDLEDRGLFDSVLVVVMGEFGRTPKINTGLPNDPVPGRDHWGSAVSVMMAGGGLKTGQIVGRTDAEAAYPADRPLRPQDVLATIYKVMGIDPASEFFDRQNRPIPVLSEGDPISELF